MRRGLTIGEFAAAHPSERPDAAPLPRGGSARARRGRPVHRDTATTPPSRSRPPRSSTGSASWTSRWPRSSRSSRLPTRSGGPTLIAGHLRRLEDELDRTRAAVTSLRQLLQPDADELRVELRSVPARTVAAIAGAGRPSAGPSVVRRSDGRARRCLPGAERTGPPGGRYASELFTDGAGELLVYRPVRRPSARRADRGVELAGRRVGRRGPSWAARRHRRHLRPPRRLGRRPRPRRRRADPRDLPRRTPRHPEPAEWRTEIGWPIFRLAPDSAGCRAAPA